MDQDEEEAGRRLASQLACQPDDEMLLMFYDSVKAPAEAMSPPVMNASPPLIRGIEAVLGGEFPIVGAGVVADTEIIDSTRKNTTDLMTRITYYKTVAENTGVLRLRETDTLSNTLVERTWLDEELQRHRDHLEELVETRTAELFSAVAEAQQLNVQFQQEILERRRAEEAIRESEERFRDLAHNSTDVIMRFGHAFRHLYVNPVVTVQTGIPHQEYIGKTHKELGFPVHLIRIWEDAIQAVFDSRESHRIEFQLPNQTWIDWLLFPELSQSGEVSAVLTTARDITPYKSIEETLRQELIERQRSEKKQRLLETQICEIQKHEALGRLAGGIAHDFNNALSIMMGHVEVLLQDSPQENGSHISLGHVWRAGERAAELIRQISLITRVQDHHLESTDLSQVIQETLSLIRATIPTSIEIRSHIQPNCSPIMADTSQVQQVIVNLCVNAKHAMREQGGTLTVSLEESTYRYGLAQKLGLIAGTYLRLTISDTGQGISAHVHERIFEPFFTTKNVGEGSGLGLAVVQGIVTGHGGVMSVESDVGKGTVFSIHFPVSEALAVQPSPTKEMVDSREGQGHVLVVDDEDDLIKLYELALKKFGFQVTTCANGNDALKVFRATPNRFDLVFTDQLMPGLTGTQLSAELLNIREDVPIILATGYSDSVLEHNAEDYGLRELFLKPVKLRNLVSSIQMILSQQESMDMLEH